MALQTMDAIIMLLKSSRIQGCYLPWYATPLCDFWFWVSFLWESIKYRDTHHNIKTLSALRLH